MLIVCIAFSCQNINEKANNGSDGTYKVKEHLVSRGDPLDPKDDEVWLHGNMEEAKSIIKPLDDGLLDYYPCQPIKQNKKLNRVYLGNVPEIQNRKYYPELEEVQEGLF